MKEVNYRRIPNCLRKFRKINGYTQKQVAIVLGVRNSSMVSRWENGQRFPNPINILRLSALYKTMVDSLYIDTLRIIRSEIQRRLEKTINHGK